MVQMSDLLADRRSGAAAEATPGTGRPWALSAALAGLVASGGVLLGCMALALAGWFASDAASYGATTDALRVGADGWLLAHGAHLQLVGGDITVVPLGLTLFCAYVTYRLGRWAAATSAVAAGSWAEDVRTVGLGTVVLAGVYGVVAVLTAVLASAEAADPHLGRAFLGGVAVGLLGGGPGIAVGSGAARSWWLAVPGGARAVLVGAVAAALLMVAASAAVLAASLLLHLGSAATVLSSLHVDTAGGLLYSVVTAAVTPNAVLLAASYLLGPGFALGTGTVVSPSAVVLGPLPAFPLLAALPHPGAGAWWLQAYVALPVLLGALAAFLAVRRFPQAGWSAGALRGGVAGLCGGLLLTVVTALAGGAVGPGRMADVGAFTADVFVAAMVTLGVGGLLGGLAATWWARRHPYGEDAAA